MRRDRAAAPDWTIRCATRADLAAVLELWEVADVRPSATDSIESLRTLLAADAQALLVADACGELVGSLIAAWNGWRGSLYRLAVRPDEQRRGLATLLVREGERRLRERGAVRLDAVVAADEVAAAAFWSAVGYVRRDDQARFVRELRR